MKTLSATFPVCITLGGHVTAQYGKPVLMTDSQHEVRVVSSKVQSDVPEVTTMWKFIAQELGLRPFPIHVITDMPISHHGTQAAMIVGMVDIAMQFSKRNVSIMELQNKSYDIEKKIFKLQSHAQTVTCIQKGLIFYRKEFEFYKTVVQLPAKLPETFRKNLYLDLQDGTQDLTYVEKNIKRLVFAISQENWNMFKETLSNISDSEASILKTSIKL